MTEAGQRLVEENHNLIYKFLSKNRLDFTEYYDLCAIAFCRAADAYDETIGTFSTIAFYYMETCVRAERRRQSTIGRKPSGPICSMDEPLFNYSKDEDTCVGDSIASPGDIEDEIVTRAVLTKYLSSISDRDKQIVQMYLDGYNLREVGENFGISYQRVMQILSKFQRYLKDVYGEEKCQKFRRLSNKKYYSTRTPSKKRKSLAKG